MAEFSEKVIKTKQIVRLAETCTNSPMTFIQDDKKQ